MSDREVYESPPVVLVALEIRHTTAEPTSRSATAAIKRAMAAQFPLAIPAVTYTLTGSPSGTSHETHKWPRYVSRDKTSSVTFRDEALVVETTRYQDFETLRHHAELAIDALQRHAPVDGVERIGMRYINEIRVPDLAAHTEWTQWVSPALVSPTLISPSLDLDLQSWQGIASFGGQGGTSTVVRHGPFEGYAVNPGGDLKRSTPTPGPFFLIDIDGYWAPEAETPDLDSGEVIGHLDDIHASIKDLFEHLITERLRQEVLRHAS